MTPRVKGNGVRRHFEGMKTWWTIAFLLAGAVRADEAADRKAIEGVMDALNRAGERHSLFEAGVDVDKELKRLDAPGCDLLEHPKVWNELPPSRFNLEGVQFLAADMALADVRYTQHPTPMATIRTPLVVILKREGGEWKIATLRALTECMGMPRILPAK